MKRHQILFLISVASLMFCVAAAPLTANDIDWPTFRGADRTGIAPDTGLLQQWPAAGPELVWEAAGAGRGYASVAISAGRLYTLGDGPSTAGDADEYLTCFDQATGKQLWSSKTGPAWTDGEADWQSSRGTPTIDGDRVYVISPHGKLVCVNTDGTEQWRVDLKEKFGGKKDDPWGYSESVLVDGDNLICTPGGPKNTMVALNKNTGKRVWSTSRPNDRGAGHASVVISKVGSTRVYVQTTGSGALGVRAADGKLLWSYEIEKTTAVIPTPIIRDDLVFFTVGYNRGGALLRQSADGSGGVSVEEIYPLNQKLNNKHGGLVLVGDFLYGDSNDNGIPFCAELMTGEIRWKSRGSGKKSASVVAADGHLYIRYANGTMTLVKADPDSFQEVSSFQVPGSGDRPSWAHPVILDGRLYLREGDKILCYKISSQPGSTTPKAEDAGLSQTDVTQPGASSNGLRVNAGESFVRTHGQLSVQGTKLVDAQGEPIVLRGVSYGWHNWWHQFYNAGAVGWLADDWKCTVIRAAMGVGPEGSYLDRPKWSQKLVRTVVDAAIANDIYVIIDWHDHNAHEHTDKAVAFFTEMATLYGDQPNVIYEIYNEPVDVAWPEVKRYSKKVIDAIRAIDPDNIILVGNPHWDQDVHIAADDPMTGVKNIMYTLHFYADTHKQSLRDRGDYALSKGLPLFVSEYGGCAATGNGPLNMEEWNAWIAWMEKHNISWAKWSISAKDETCSMLPAEAADTGNWPVDTLQPSGAYTRELLRRLNSLQSATSSDILRVQEEALVTKKRSAFSWSSDGSSESTFVNSTHPIIPGHYEYVPNPAGEGTVFQGRLTEDVESDDPESVHLHPDIYFDKYHPGSFTVSFDVWVDDLKPDVLGPYRDKPWLNVVTIFDRTTQTGDSTFAPSVMTNLVGSPAAYYLQTYSMSPSSGGTYFEKEPDAPVFPTGQWVSVKVQVDVETARVRTYQNGTMVSDGPYKSRPGLAGAHMGLYANRLMKQATIYNRNCAIQVGSSRKPGTAGEMLVNGSFASGHDNWQVKPSDDDATAKFESVKEGPNSESALRMEVLTISDEPWHLQMFQPGLSIEKDKPYVLTFWAKSNRDGTIKVNCMQNHEPWEHSTEQEIFLSSEWKQKEFTFDGPWDDHNARITFTDLGTEEGRIYWFTNCSLTPKIEKE